MLCGFFSSFNLLFFTANQKRCWKLALNTFAKKTT